MIFTYLGTVLFFIYYFFFFISVCLFSGKNKRHLVTLQLILITCFAERKEIIPNSSKALQMTGRQLWIKDTDKVWFAHIQLVLHHKTYSKPYGIQIKSCQNYSVSCGPMIILMSWNCTFCYFSKTVLFRNSILIHL